ncbi:MAG: histidinol dehydrogenase, partial [Solirubrobacterales bacterium]
MPEGTPMRVLRWSALSPEERDQLLERGIRAIFDPALQEAVGRIVDDVRENGDAAVCRALEEFDGCRVQPGALRVTAGEFARAREQVPAAVLAAIATGIANVRAFNEELVGDRRWQAEIAPGLTVGERSTPVASAGLFVPSGKGSFPSVLVQIGTPAMVAGVPELAVVVPPGPGGGDAQNGRVDLAAELGIANVFRVNGPAGVAALAFGTESIPKVRKVLGPGSPPVQAA